MNTLIMSKNKGFRRITESLLLAPPYDNDVSTLERTIVSTTKHYSNVCAA